MRELLTYVIAGAVTGSVYGLAAMGLVLTYKTSGVFNFAHGAVGAVGAYVFYELSYNTWHLPWGLSVALSVLVAGPLLGLIVSTVAGSLSQAALAMKVVAMVGLLLLIQAIATLHYGGQDRFLPSFLPSHAYKIGSIFVGADQLITVGIGVVAAAGLSVFFRVTRLGMAMRAVVDNQELLRQTGVSARRVQLASWVIGSSFAVLSGILLAPQLGLHVIGLTLLVIQAFGAAAIGRFTSLTVTFLGGIAIAVAAALIKGYITSTALNGLSVTVPFIALFAALVLLRQPTTAEPVGQRWAPMVTWASPFQRGAGIATTLAVAAILPPFVGLHLTSYNSAVIYGVLFLSLGFLVRLSGQTSLCHAAFAAVGAAALPHLVAHNVPWMVSLVLGGVLAGLAGTVVAVPAIRLSGLYLALATLAAGLMFQNLLFAQDFMFGTGSLATRRPHGFTGDKPYYYLCLIVFGACIALVVAVQRSRLGRLLQGTAEAPTAIEVAGTNVTFLRVVAFSISAFFAGIAGGLLSGLYGTTGGNGFSPFLSLTLLAVLALAGAGTVKAAVVASLSFQVIPSYITNSDLNAWLSLLFGGAAVAVAVVSTRARVERDMGSEVEVEPQSSSGFPSWRHRTLSPVAARRTWVAVSHAATAHR